MPQMLRAIDLTVVVLADTVGIVVSRQACDSSKCAGSVIISMHTSLDMVVFGAHLVQPSQRCPLLKLWWLTCS